MIMTSIQRMSYCYYADSNSIEDYKKVLDLLIDRYISVYGGCLVSNGRLSLDDRIWGVELSEAAKNWFVENGKNAYDFRDKVFEWLFDNRMRD